MSKGDHGRTLTVLREENLPLEECSGICLQQDVSGMTLIAIGDRAATVVLATLPDGDDDPLPWRTIALDEVEGSRIPAKDPQLEAVCSDGSDRYLLVQESPPRAELMQGGRVLTRIALEIPPGHALADAWSDVDASRGEGVVLLGNGHLLIAKEKDPPSFIEFGPEGEAASGTGVERFVDRDQSWPVAEGDVTYVPLATWMPDHDLEEACEDLSDLEVGPDGRLYVLSDKSATIARLADLGPERRDASADAVWRLDGLDGKPEGLAFTANGRAIVALDTRKAKHNLYLMEPAIASRD